VQGTAHIPVPPPLLRNQLQHCCLNLKHIGQYAAELSTKTISAFFILDLNVTCLSSPFTQEGVPKWKSWTYDPDRTPRGAWPWHSPLRGNLSFMRWYLPWSTILPTHHTGNVYLHPLNTQEGVWDLKRGLCNPSKRVKWQCIICSLVAAMIHIRTKLKCIASRSVLQIRGWCQIQKLVPYGDWRSTSNCQQNVAQTYPNYQKQ